MWQTPCPRIPLTTLSNKGHRSGRSGLPGLPPAFVLMAGWYTLNPCKKCNCKACSFSSRDESMLSNYLADSAASLV